MNDNEEWGEIEPVETADDFGEVEPLRWEDGDGGEERLPEGERNKWGGNLRNEGRRVLFRRDKDGKVNGYSTTSSMLVRHDDGKFAVAPTVVGGKELSQEEAVKHYAETGEHWGMADDEDSAQKMAQEVHDTHMKDNQTKWNDYIHEHWDEVSDEIRNDRGTAYEHKKRTAPDKITLMERLANDDTEEERKKRDEPHQKKYVQTGNGHGIIGYSFKFMPNDRNEEQKRSDAMDDLAAIAKDAGLADWQVKRIRSESKTPEEMREALKYVAGNRPVRDGEEPEKGAVGWRSVPKSIVNTAGKAVAGFINLVGTVSGGVDEDARHAFMADDPMAKKDGETFDAWLGRVNIDEKVKRDPAVRENLEKYFRWEVPIAGKEGMHQEHSVMVQNGREGTGVGNMAIRDAKRLRNWLDEKTPVGNSGSPVVDWLEGAASGIAQFAYLGPAMIAMSSADAYQQTRSTALESGKGGDAAEGLAAGSALFDGAMTAAFYYAPFRRWMNGRGIVPVQPVEKFTFGGLSKAMGRFNAKREFLNQGVAAIEAGGIMGVQGAGDTAFRQLASGQDLDLGEITIEGLKGVRDGVAIGAIMGAGRILNARIKGARDYEKVVRAAAQTPDGRLMLASLNSDGMMDLKRFIQEGIDVAEAHKKPAADFEADTQGNATKGRAPAPDWKPTEETMRKFNELCDRAGLPPDAKLASDILFDPRVANYLGDTLNAKFRNAANVQPEHAAIPEKPIIDAETGKVVSPSQALAKRVRSEFGVEPANFNLPQTADGKPGLVPMKWRDNKTGKENTSGLAHDSKTGVTIMEEADGTFSVHNDTGDSDGADTLGEAVEKARELALMGQYTVLDRERKRRVIENERAAKYGKRNVVYFNTMADAAQAFENGIEREGSFLGLANANQLRNPVVQDRDAFYTPDGTAVVILDNVQEVGDIPRILAHEIVGHGGPNAEFGGRTGAQAVFAENIRAKGFDAFKKQVSDGLFPKLHCTAEEVNRNLGEVFAHYASVNLDKEPSKLDKLVNSVNRAARKVGLRKTYSAADVRTMMAKWRDAAKGDGGTALNLTDGSPRFDFFAPESSEKPAEAPGERGEVQTDKETPKPAEAPTGDSGASGAASVEPRRLTSADEVVATAKTPFNDAEKTTLKDAADVSGIDATDEMPSQTDFLSILSKDAPVVRLNPAKVDRSDAVLPNMKKDANRTSGITKPLSGEWHPTMGGIGAAWLTKDGKLVVITGRHRSELAERKGKSMLYYLYREADGFTKDDALIYDAVANIHDEKGTINDYLGFLDRINPTREQAGKAGILSGKGLVAWSLYKDATEAVRSATAMDGNPGEGQITPQQATVIAEAAPRDADKRNPSIQRQLLKTALGGMRGKAFDMYARIRAEKLSKTSLNENLLAGEQMDLFSSPEDQAADILAQRQSQYRTKKAQGYMTVAQNLRAALNKEGKLELTDEYAKDLGVTDKGDKKQLEAAYDKAVERANYWENAIQLEEADKTAMNTEINAAADAKAKRLAELKAQREAAKSGRAAGKPNTKTVAGPKSEKKEVQKPATTEKKSEVPYNNHGVPIGEVGDKIELENGIKATITTRKDGSKKWTINQGKRWTVDGGKTWNDGLKPEDRFTDDDFDADKVPTNVHFGHQKNESGIWEVDYIRQNGEYELKPVPKTEDVQTAAPTTADPHSEEVPAPAKPRTPSIKMKDEAAEKKAKAALDAIDFDTPELSADSTILSSDEVRKTMPGYNRLDWSTHVDRKGDYVGPRMEAQFQRLLKERKGKGDGTVVFLAGGNGAGKSTVAARIGDTHDFTIDSTLGNLDVAKKQIDAILANGQTPEIHFVYRTPGQALEGIAQRVKNGGHIVSPLSFANSHVKSRENLWLLSEAYGDKMHIHVYDNSVEGAPEITLEQFKAKRKIDHARIRESANYYLGHLREREEARVRSQGGVAGSSAKGEAEQVDFDTPNFDPEKFGKLVTGVGKLVDVLVESGHKDFRALATYIYEQDAAKYERAKPVLRNVWNQIADLSGLDEVSRKDADNTFKTIETQTKEVENGADTRGQYGVDAAEPATSGGEQQSRGVLADRPVREQNPNGRVDGQRSGDVPGLGDKLAEREASESGKNAERGASEGNGAVRDSAESTHGEREDGRDSGEDGHNANAHVKKRARKAADSKKPNPQRRDFVMTKAVEEAILEKKTAQRVRNNLEAIKLIRDLKARDYAATPDEQATLAKFVGWGGLREDVFGYGLERAYDLERSGDVETAKRHLRREGISQSAYDLHKELRSVLNDNEYESAKASASTAFYTPIYFVQTLHENLRYLGVKGGRFLGPSAGTGNFASAAGEYEKPVNWQFVEKDAMTGELLKALFPNQRVTVGGFEDTKFPDGFFDFAIDNVPYADVPINDRSLSSKMFKIHDYFFAKTLSKLRPGGVMAFLTSTGTLDKTSPILRQFLTEHGGKIVGAVRLPNGFFSENAGTDAASDLVIVQRVQRRPDNTAFERGVEYGKTEEWVRRKGRIEKPLTYNGYFQDHPEQIVGTMEITSGQFGPTLKYTMPDVLPGDLSFEISKAIGRALGGIDKDALLKSAAVAEQQDHTPIYDEEGLRQGNVTMQDGKPFIKSGEMLEPIVMPNDHTLAKELAKRFKLPTKIMEGLLDLRKAMRDVIDAQMSESDTVEADLAPLLAKLNEVYDTFVKKNGTLHDKWVSPFVLLDRADGNRMLALERVVKDENGKTKVVKSDIFTKRVISRGQRATKADTPKDALVISYSESGAINVPRIAELLGVNHEEAIEKLKEGGDAFENPQTGLLEPSWEYLSGRVRAKLAAARAAVDAGEESYRANIEALEKVQPPMVRLEDAEIKFGATWIEPECMKDFLRDAFGSESMRINLGKNEVTGQWNVEFGRVMNEDPWGETSWTPQEFVSRVLNHGSMNHYDTDPVDKKRYLNERRTEENKLAAEKLHHAFSQFVQSSERWAEPMYERYNAVMTDMVEIKLPNNVLPFRAAGMSEATLGKLFEGGDPKQPKKGREYQSDVIARGVLGGNSLCLAHCVGAGKTLEMQSIGVLGRHLGLFKKPMYVVPNHMLEQFTNEFVEAFPNANILKMSEADVKPENRRAFFAQVANGDWDAIVVKHSTFSKKLAMSDEYQKEFIEAQRRDLIEAIAAMREAGEKISVDQATKKLERLEAKLEQLANAENHDSQIVPFEELGVDQLFVDEAHNFKGMPITTRQGRTGGLSQGDSQRAVDMQMKTQYVQSLHGGDRGVVFATGTPLSNAPVVEAYVILKYLAPNKLEEQGLKHFDDFVDAFGRITTESEFSLDGKTVKEKEKVSAFVNIPELMKLLRSVVDIVNPDQLDIPRPKPKYHMIDVDMSPAQEQIMEMVAREAATPPSREDRNKYLTLTRVAKNACLTPRLLGYTAGGNKIIRAVAEIKKVYDETADNHGAQLVFTDIFNESLASGMYVDAAMATGLGTTLDGKHEVFGVLPKRLGGTYNLNEEIRDLLVAAGIPKDEIAIVQDIDKSKGDKDANKGALFTKVRAGEVRVLIGSRPKMGEGTNVQERLAAIHLLHPGWKPSEDEQAIGRIIRFGNTYNEGRIFYYLTKGNANIGSYETKNHQLIGVKSKLIDQVMHGDDSVREIDMDESAMDRDMLMGLASGNKALMELIDVKKRVHKLELNTESTLTSARRNKDKAEANSRILERRREEFAKEQEGVKEWREKNEGKPFALATPDGRSIEKVKDMAEYVAAQVVRELTKDRYDRDDRTVLGDFNGVELVLAYDKWGDEKFRLAVPLLGVAREINYSGFIPDFSQAAMTAFKGKIFETVSLDFAKAYENSLADMDRQAKKMSADADKLQKDYEVMRDELIKLRTRQAELERAVTPLVIQAVENRKAATYGNWLVTKPGNGRLYVANRESDSKSVSAPTVKELIPLMNAEDFASPRNAATKTIDLRPHLKPNSKGEYPHVDTLSAGQVDFDTPNLNADYSTVPERLDHSLWWISAHDAQMADDIVALRKAAERNIKAGADDTPSESEARDLKRRINEENAKARARKKLADETSFPDIKKRYLEDERHYRENAKELRDQLKELEKEGEGEDRDEVDWYTYGDLLEILDAIESGEASTSMHFDPYAIGRGMEGPFAAAFWGMSQYNMFNGKNLERFNRLAKKVNDAYKRIEVDIEDPRGPFGESLVSFDTPDLSPSEQAYSEAEDKTPTEKVMREVYGMTNGEMATALKAAGMEPPKHVRKPDETAWKQAEALLSNPSYMAKLSKAVAKFPRNIADYENNALNVLFRQRQAAVNAAQTVVDGLKKTIDAFNAIPKEERDTDFNEEQKKTEKDYAEAKAKLAQAKSLMFETGLALTRSSSEAGRRLRSNRGLIDQTDYSYAGISGEVAAILGGADKITPEMDAKIREIAGEFASLDESGRDLATVRLKAHAEKIVEQIKNADKMRRAIERKPGDEVKRVMRNYNDALAQIEVGAAEVGGTCVGLSDQQYPAWGKWLRAIGEYHCFANPDITEDECINAIVEDISPFMDGVDANQVRDALTGFGHNFRQSRYEAQRMMNDLRSQSRLKRQLDWMDENNTMPPLTGLVRDGPSDTTRNLQKQVQERKAEVPDAGRDERRLKGVLESVKTRVKNRIADLERAIETGEKIPGRDRTVLEDIELRELKKRKDELQKTYDELFKTERGMTDEQRVKLAERLLGRELEHALVDLDRARSGDFSKRQKRPGVESPTLDALRDRLNEVRGQIRELKNAKYEFGMTPDELNAYNARKMANREKAVARLAERIVRGDLRSQKKPQPPMSKEMQTRYDELAEQMSRAHRKLADLRREAADARKPKFVRFLGNAYRFVDGVWKMATASLDFTQVGNQTGSILMAHPKLVAENFAKTISAFKSVANAESIELDILSDASVKEAVDNGWLSWKKVSDSTNRGERVELFDAIDKPFTIGGKAIRLTDIPIYGTAIANSDRLYATYINAASASLYSTIINDPKLFPGGATVFQKKMLCDMINVMNGSGTLSKGARRYAGKVFWAPGLVDSQLKRLLGYQVWHPWLASAEEDGSGTFKERATMSKIGLGEFVRSNLGALLLGGLLFALFATDDQKDEYAHAGLVKKLRMMVAPRIRHTQLDFTGGSVAFLRLGNRLMSGAYETATGKQAKVRDMFSEVAHFAKGRLTPLVSNAFSAMSGKDYTGQDYGAVELLLSFAPISLREAGMSIYENGIEDRAWGTAFLGAGLTMFGVGKGTYRKDDYALLSNRFLEFKKEYDAIEKDDLIDEQNRKLMLDSIIAENPLMREEVREDIAADIAQIRKDETRARKDEKEGNEPDADLLSEIATGKAKLIEKIRAARRK